MTRKCPDEIYKDIAMAGESLLDGKNDKAGFVFFRTKNIGERFYGDQ